MMLKKPIADIKQAAGALPRNLLLPMRTVITDIRKETGDIFTYSLRLSGDDKLPCAPGQFNMVGLPGIGEAPISFSSIEGEISFKHTIRAVGRVTKYFASLSVGDEMHVRGPYGRGWPIEAARGGDVLLVAGGLGIAPLRPVIHGILNNRTDFGNVTLVFGARDPRGMIFLDEITKWEKQIKVMLCVDEVPKGQRWPHSVGLVVEFLGQTGLSTEKTTSFVCGPEIMMRFVSRRLLIGGFKPSGLYVSLERRMKCGVAQCGHCQFGHFFVCKDGPVFLYRDVSELPDGLL